MPEIVRDAPQEFWHAPIQKSSTLPPSSVGLTACYECGAEFVPGAAFCHACGESRDISYVTGWMRRFEISSLQGMFGLALAPLLSLFLGLACGVAALLAGIFSNPQTILDWQVVQSWRIEWLLASVACFVAGLLLKRPSPR